MPIDDHTQFIDQGQPLTPEHSPFTLERAPFTDDHAPFTREHPRPSHDLAAITDDQVLLIAGQELISASRWPVVHDQISLVDAARRQAGGWRQLIRLKYFRPLRPGMTS